MEEVAKCPSSSPKHVGFADDVKDTLHGGCEDGPEDEQRERPEETQAQKEIRDDNDDGDSEHTDSEIYEEEEDGVGDDFEA